MTHKPLHPDALPPEPPRFVGWRRPPGGALQMVEGTLSRSNGEVYNLLMSKCALRVNTDLEEEYQILLVGERPTDQQYQRYRDKEMRPSRQ